MEVIGKMLVALSGAFIVLTVVTGFMGNAMALYVSGFFAVFNWFAGTWFIRANNKEIEK